MENNAFKIWISGRFSPECLAPIHARKNKQKKNYQIAYPRKIRNLSSYAALKILKPLLIPYRNIFECIAKKLSDMCQTRIFKLQEVEMEMGQVKIKIKMHLDASKLKQRMSNEIPSSIKSQNPLITNNNRINQIYLSINAVSFQAITVNSNQNPG